MEKPDERMGRVLEAFRDAEIPEGMEGRILRALNRKAAEPRRMGWFALPGFASGRMAMAGLALCALVAGALGYSVLRHAPEERSAVNRSTVNGARQVALPGTGIGSAGEHEEAPVAKRVEAPPVQATLERHATERAGNAAAHEEQARVEETGGHPAPPMPLTEQERLLLQVARQNDPQQMDLLNQQKQDELTAKKDEEFHKFFAALTTPPPPEKDKTEIAASGEPL